MSELNLILVPCASCLCSLPSSVESFERKLDEAQKNLQMSPAQRIPVFYTDEINWGEQLIKCV